MESNEARQRNWSKDFIKFENNELSRCFKLKYLLHLLDLALVSDLDKWILLLYGLPTKKGAARVNLWRQLRKCGALPLKTSAYLLPDKPEHYERLQWLAQ